MKERDYCVLTVEAMVNLHCKLLAIMIPTEIDLVLRSCHVNTLRGPARPRMAAAAPSSLTAATSAPPRHAEKAANSARIS